MYMPCDNGRDYEFSCDLESDCSEISEDETSSSVGRYIMKVYLCIIG